jgi:hypothetical protein
MPLQFPGQTSQHHEGGLNVRAKDAASGQNVPVRISDEAIQDHGLDKAKAVAERKYDAGQTEPNGGVWVRVGDF